MLRLTRRTNWRNKTPGQIWWIVGTVAGRRVRQTTATRNHELAELILHKRERELVGDSVLGESSRITFKEAAELYVEVGGEERFLDPLVKLIGHKRLAELTPQDVLMVCRKRYPNSSPATRIRQVYTPLNAVLRYAHREQLCELRAFKKPKCEKRPVQAAPDSWLAEFTEGAPPHLAAAALFLSFSGARATEACRLKWKDIDLATGRALLSKTKNGQSRQVTLAPIVISAIKRLALESEPDPEATVFGFSQRWSLTNAIKRHCKSHDLRYYPTHAIGRHSFATRLLNQGHSLMTVKEAGGWKSINMVTDHYGHLEKSFVHEVVANADKSFGKGQQL